MEMRSYTWNGTGWEWNGDGGSHGLIRQPVEKGISMQWETIEIPTPDPKVRLEAGPVFMSIGESGYQKGQRWQYAAISLGENTLASMAECEVTWPRRAIELCRKALDEFEVSLNGGQNETDPT